MVEPGAPAWGVTSLLIVVLLGLAVALRRRTSNREIWRYDVQAAWLRALVYAAACGAIAAATGTLATLRSLPLVLPGQTSDVAWIVATVIVALVVIVGYWVVWPIGTEHHGRLLVLPDTVVFGLVWGGAQGLLYASVWVTSVRLLGDLPAGRVWVALVTIIVLAIFSGLWQATYWDKHVSPEHNIPEWNLRKVALVHNPNLILTVIWVTVWGNLGLWVGLETVALVGSAIGMRFPTFRSPIPQDPTRPTLGPPVSEPVDLTGRTIAVTGGANGIGRAIVTQLAAQGARVLVLDRDAAEGQALIARISEDGGRAEFHPVDLTDHDAVRAVTDKLRTKLVGLDVLINNAGVFIAGHDEVGGRELTTATNLDGHHLLTHELLPLLRAAMGRVVVVSSDAHRQALERELDDESLSGFAAYRRSKALVTAAAVELAEQSRADGVTVNIVTPGALVPTAIYDDLGPIVQRLLRLGRPALPTPEDAAFTAVRVATSPELDGVTGWYWKDGRPTVASALTRDPVVRRRVWDDVSQRTNT